ncbi:hypothetical protein A2U01_0033297 [Trifolium medium]|uniref:Uncharacterized protein n=1 Tax=Trifolium medium TaxID=97028 RepID=A0A392PK49_9FABA|nr:hypothetical protein [Trifolium medium]
MENDFFVFPSDVSAEAEALKAKFGDAVDKLSQIIQKKVEGRGIEAVKMIMESVERSKVKRLTLTPHYDPTVEEFVVNEVLSVFKQAEEEEKRKQEEEEK